MATVTNTSTKNLMEELADLTPYQKLVKLMSLLEHTLSTMMLYNGETYKFTIAKDYTYDVHNNIIGVPVSIFESKTAAPMIFKIFKALGEMLLRKKSTDINTPSRKSIMVLDKYYDFKIKLNVVERAQILREMDLCCFAYKMQICTPSPDKYIIDESLETFIKNKNFETHAEATEAFDRYIMIQNLCREVMTKISNEKDDDSTGTAKGQGLNKPLNDDDHRLSIADEVMASVGIRGFHAPLYEQIEYLCDVIIEKKDKCMTSKDKEFNDHIFVALNAPAKFIKDELKIVNHEILKSKTETHHRLIIEILNLMKKSGGITVIDQMKISNVIFDSTKEVENRVKTKSAGLLSYNDRVRMERERRFGLFREACGYDNNITYAKLNKFPQIKQEFEDHLKANPIVIVNPNEK